jgi:hypothetical protein
MNACVCGSFMAWAALQAEPEPATLPTEAAPSPIWAWAWAAAQPASEVGGGGEADPKAAVAQEDAQHAEAARPVWHPIGGAAGDNGEADPQAAVAQEDAQQAEARPYPQEAAQQAAVAAALFSAGAFWAACKGLPPEEPMPREGLMGPAEPRPLLDPMAPPEAACDWLDPMAPPEAACDWLAESGSAAF